MTLRRTSYELKWGGIWSRPVWFDLVWSCGTRLPSPVDDWEARPLSYWNTPEKTHERHLQFLTSSFVSHTGTGGGRGGVNRVPGVNSVSHTCWTLDAAYLYGRRQLRRGGRRFWMLHFNCSFKSFSNIVPSPLFSHPRAPILRCGLVKVTLQCPTQCD